MSKVNRLNFRGLTAKGEMVVGDLIHDMKGTTAYWDEYSQRIAWQVGTAYHNCPVKNGTVGQSTGLTTSAGVEMFEGDRVKCTAINNDHNQKGAITIMTIKYFMGNACLCFDGSDSGVTLYPFNVTHWMEVVGNIHQVPTSNREKESE